jgi:phage gp29-like protein
MNQNPVINETAGESAAGFLGKSMATPEPGNAEPSNQLAHQFGAYGTQIFSGFITGEEYNPDLAGHNGLRVFDEMRRSDASVRASLDIISLPIMGADWDIEPASDSPEDQLIAEFVKHNLMERIPWRDFLREALLMLPYGFSVFEKVYKLEQWTGDKDGKGAGMYWTIDKLASRKQDTIYAWQMKDGTAGVRQISPSGGEFEIPANKLIIFTHNREGANFEGISMLRPAYKHWFIKAQLEKILAIAAERQGVGIPYLIPPENASEADKVLARTAVKNMRANEQSYVEIPKGWEIGFVKMEGGSNFDPMPQIQYHDRQILKNVLGQFMEMGGHSGSGGTQGASTDQSRLLTQAIEAVAAVIRDGLNNNLIKQLVDANFSVAKYPTVMHDRLSDENVTELATALSSLKDFITPDADLEDNLRETLHVPALPDDIKNDYANRPGHGTNAPALPGAATIGPDGKPVADPSAQKVAENKPAEKPKAEETAVKASETHIVDGLREFHDAIGQQLKALHGDNQAG